MKRSAIRQAAPRRPANQPAAGRIDARNAVQRVAERPCAICGGPVVCAARGPAPRACGACGGHVRDVRQLRAYFASAERLAHRLDRASIAAVAREGVAAIDGEVLR